MCSRTGWLLIFACRLGKNVDKKCYNSLIQSLQQENWFGHFCFNIWSNLQFKIVATLLIFISESKSSSMQFLQLKKTWALGQFSEIRTLYCHYIVIASKSTMSFA